jgi:hypothetical protein
MRMKRVLVGPHPAGRSNEVHAQSNDASGSAVLPEDEMMKVVGGAGKTE